MKQSVLLSLIMLFGPLMVKAQTHEIKKMSIEQGLSNSYVVSITQDRKGFLWFASESGLSRFDGSKFKVYKKSSSYPKSSISGNELNKVYADKYDDVVWIATQREGLNMFDCATEEFVHYKSGSKTPEGIITNDITDIINSRDGNIWIATYYRGIELFDKANQRFEHYNKHTVPGMVSNNAWTVDEDSRGAVYIGHVSTGLSLLFPATKTIKNFRNDPADSNSLPGDEVRAVYVDRNDNVWVGTNKGLALFNREKENFTVFNEAGSPGSYIFSIVQLEDGRLWIGTEKGGINILDIKQNMFTPSQQVKFENISFSDDRTGLSNPTIRSIYQDSFQNIWIATYGGGVNFISHQPTFFHTWVYSPIPGQNNTLSNPIAWGICADKNDRIWVGTDGGGLNVFEGEKRIKTYNQGNNAVEGSSILSALKDTDDKLWFGSFRDGVSVFDADGKPHAHFLINEQMIDVRCFFQHTQDEILIGTSNGICRVNRISGERELFSRNNSTLPNDLVRTLSRDNQGRIWVGFFGEGIAILNPDLQLIRQYRIDNGLPSNTINHIYKDSKGKMWLATGEGLVCVLSTDSIDQPEFVLFNEKNGLPDTHVRAITEDKDGNIWIGTNNGICRLAPGSKHFSSYDYSHGVPLGEVMSGSVTKDSRGIIYFGTQNGVCYFDPQQIPEQLQLPPTMVTEFKVYGNLKKGIDREITVPVSSEITLKHDQNTFSVSFNVIDYSLYQQVDYMYLLKGLETVWYSTKGENSITFRNIPPGDYELLIRTRIKNQDWSEDITSLKVVIQPPFWATRWAKLGYGLIVLVISLLVLRFYKRKLDLESSLLLEKRNLQQEQHLNDERLRFFTNITHELRTPLTLILGPLDDLYNDSSLDWKHSEKVSLIHRSATRLLNLINQILEFRTTETQNKKLVLRRENIAVLIEEIGLKYRGLNQNRQVTLHIEIKTERPVLYFDPDMMSSIIENLLSNAFKYTEQGSITLTVRDKLTEGNDFLEIEVCDTGTGIAPEALPHIFDRYYQAGNSRQKSGTGIGLALVSSLVSLHKGKVSVQSELGKGTSFLVCIKREYIDSEENPENKIRESHPDEVLSVSGEESSDEKQVVLVVEDNDEIREYIIDSLSLLYRVHAAENGQIGLEKAYAHIPDIIISDIMMPEMDGFELSRILKSDIRTSHIPLILLTAKDSIRDKTEGYAIGVESYITKPFTAQLLKSRIENLFRSRQQIAQLISKNTITRGEAVKEALTKIDNEFIERLTAIIEEDLSSDKINVAYIAGKMNMSHATLYRKVKALSNLSVNEFIRKIRLRNAGELLLTGKYSVSEVSFLVGINSMTYFRNCFKDEYGVLPSEYVQKIIEEETQKKPF